MPPGSGTVARVAAAAAATAGAISCLLRCVSRRWASTAGGGGGGGHAGRLCWDGVPVAAAVVISCAVLLPDTGAGGGGGPGAARPGRAQAQRWCSTPAPATRLAPARGAAYPLFELSMPLTASTHAMMTHAHAARTLQAACWHSMLSCRCTRRCLQIAGYLHTHPGAKPVFTDGLGCTGGVYRIRTPYVPTIQDCL